MGVENIIGIIRTEDEKLAIKTATTILDAGLKKIEITTNLKTVFDVIPTLKAKYPNAEIGIGSVKSIKQAILAKESTADFVVTPCINPQVITFCRDNKLEIYPGALTPSEIYEASSLGIKNVKIFPANCLPVNFAKSVRGPMPEVELFAVGGVDITNFEEYLQGGYIGIGLSSEIMTFANKHDFLGLENLIKEYINKMRDYENSINNGIK